jgi:thiol:disulfide interchange protein DsbD
MVLNLMPCVFPVLSIKLLSLVKHGGNRPTDAAVLRTHALAYSAGVVLSFLALAALLLALRAAGSVIGWGFQLQEPGVVFVLALLFFTLGLNLMGAFEFGGLLPQGLATWRDRRPAVDALASGVLAVLAASPCTAPFMGAALGYAITQAPAVGLSVFAALGLGMALPYSLLVLMPGWRSRLPRPGAWMLRLKQALAFPMFLTVVWLIWVLGQQTGIDGAAKALIALVVMAFAIWVASGRSRAGQSGAGQALARRAIGGLVLAGALAWGWPGAALSGGDAAVRKATPGSPDAAWVPYDETVIAKRLAAGQPVFVDFTAAWCVSCQVNKRLVLHTDATMQAFAKAGVALMRADWTQRDARITAALARLGRNGVPVYVLLRPGREPLLLPEVLTAKLVRDALATL